MADTENDNTENDDAESDDSTEAHNSATGFNEPGKEGEELPAGAPPRKKRTAHFRRDLLKRLPQLGYAGWSVGEQISVSDELGSLVDLTGDAVLAPLEALSEQRP